MVNQSIEEGGDMIGYVLQKEMSNLEKKLYDVGTSDPNEYPQTVIIIDTRQFTEFRRRELLARSKEHTVVNKDGTYYWGILTEKGIVRTDALHSTAGPEDTFGLEIPPVVAFEYKLVEGDEVGIVVNHTEKVVFICSVNGEQDPRIFRAWPKDLSGFQSDYPRAPLLVEKYGDFDLRVMTLLAPIGLGSSYWIIAPGGSGKTWLLVKLLDACLKLSKEDNNIYVMMGYVGDRPEDASQYLEVFRKNKQGHGEFHQAAWNTNPDSQVDVATFVMRRARRLTATGKHVIVLFDSISRTVAAHTASSYATGEGGMIGGGIYRQSLTDMIALLFGTHGSYGKDRSLTIIGTVLSSSDTKKTSESAVDQETSDSSTTGICRLVKIPTLRRPWVSVNEAETFTRFPDGRDFRSAKQKAEMAYVLKWIREDSGSRIAEEAHKRLLGYVRDNPLPKY